MSLLRNLRISGSLELTGSLTITGSSNYNGTFSGDGSTLTGVTGSWDGNFSGSAVVTGSLEVTGSITATTFVGDGSSLTGLTADWDGTHTGSASISGSLEINGRVTQTGLGESTYFGSQAGEDDDKTTNCNTGFGFAALKENTGGCQNTALGHGAFKTNQGGNSNIAIGYGALTLNNGGNFNVAIGSSVLGNDNTGDENTVIGALAAVTNNSGDRNTAIGFCSLFGTDTGKCNTAIGHCAGRFVTGSSTGNVFLGYMAGPSTISGGINNKLYINNTTGSALIEGDFSTSQIEFAGGVTGSSFTGSFVGDGSNLTNLPATDWDGTRNGDSEITGSLEVTEDLTVGSQITVGTSSGTENPVIHSLVSNTSENILLESSDTGAGSAPDLVLFRNAGTPQDNDTLGVVEFKTNNISGGSPFVWNGIYSRVIDASQQASALTISAFYGSSTAHGLGVHNLADSTSTGAVIINPNSFNEVPQHTLDVKGDARITSNLYITGSVTGSSFTGSFVGDGSGLTNLPQATGSAVYTIGTGAHSIKPLSASFSNISNATFSAVLAGNQNTASGVCSVVAGGFQNEATGSRSTIGGGSFNHAFGILSTVGGGGGNKACSSATVAGGDSNEALGQGSFVGGGVSNDNNGNYSSILGGGYNLINSNNSKYSAILGGSCNTVSSNHTGSFILGQHITTQESDTTYVNNVHITGSTTANGLLRISRRTTTPSPAVEGMIIASGSAGSSKLYYFDGTDFRALH